MSDIGLLMTSMFVSRQQSLPNLPEQLSFQYENSYFIEANSVQLLKSISAVQATPPEFTHIDHNSSTTLIVLDLKFKNILSQLAAKVRNKDFSGTDTTITEPSLSQLNSVNEGLNFTPNPEILADVGVNETMPSRKFKPFRNSNLPVLQYGNSGISVRVLQKLLASNGYAIRVDGVFGALTEVAVKAFQSQRKLVADGMVGTKTWGELTK
ncbi:peptidoglycan-binding domain 1 protein [Calothrix sp. NIES-4101]|nr:peptidoglycan-binding domain 1 protein [Calothrix sp. NIES-4101]